MTDGLHCRGGALVLLATSFAGHFKPWTSIVPTPTFSASGSERHPRPSAPPGVRRSGQRFPKRRPRGGVDVVAEARRQAPPAPGFLKGLVRPDVVVEEELEADDVMVLDRPGSTFFLGFKS